MLGLDAHQAFEAALPTKNVVGFVIKNNPVPDFTDRPASNYHDFSESWAAKGGSILNQHIRRLKRSVPTNMQRIPTCHAEGAFGKKKRWKQVSSQLMLRIAPVSINQPLIRIGRFLGMVLLSQSLLKFDLHELFRSCVG